MHLGLSRILTGRYFLINIFFFLLFLSSCKIEAVEFKSLKDVKVESIKEGDLTVTAVATFFNPNKSGLSLIKSEIDVLVNGKLAGNLRPVGKVKILKTSVFEIPVELNIDLKKATGNGNLFNLLLKREINLNLTGYVKVRKFIIPKRIPVDFEHNLSF